MIAKLKSLQNHKGFMKYFKNTSWLFLEKILRMVVGLFVGIWVARYLGPEQFGLFSYAQSFVGLFSTIAGLGLSSIIVRELVKDETRQNELIGTAFWLMLIGAIIVLCLLGVAINFTSNDAYTNSLVFIIASATIFQSFNVIDFYFQSILMNSSFKSKIYLIDENVTDNQMSLRYVNWNDGPEYPKLLTKEDLSQNFGKDIFFVRKVSSELTESELEHLFPRDEL